jgi:hypothetical protein
MRARTLVTATLMCSACLLGSKLPRVSPSDPVDSIVGGDTDLEASPDSASNDTEVGWETATRTWIPDGTYSGTFTYRFHAPLLTSQTCRGPITVVVDSGASPHIQASVACDWAFSLFGAATQSGYGSLTGTLSGNLFGTRSRSAEGEIAVTDGNAYADTTTWSGVLRGDLLEVTFDGRLLGIGATGTFEVTR